MNKMMEAYILTYRKRVFLLLFLLTISLNSIYSQELLLSILDSLRADSKLVSTIIGKDSCDYFDNMTNKRNFQFRNKDMIYINSYKNYSLYLMVFPQGLLSAPPPYSGFHDWGVKLGVLFDSKLQRCYYFKYSKTLRFDFENKENNTALIDAKFTRNIQNVIELDTLLNPLWSINVRILKDWYNSEEIEKGRISSCDIFFSSENTYSSKSKLLLDKKLNIANITYQDLSNQFGITAADKDSMKLNIQKVDLDVLFAGSLPGFIKMETKSGTYE
ncbi:hypothetical protein [Dysgonomonas sp. GY617]|uniref:hypothetical protein n=1 Tax=Dysgonomonas sp. GY617 TaxID=2780420 RepID=UPI00188357F3|nr:hypothetical protein [Dysgonomonas sp. GY617]MBF0576885.1 hypothetical protein [Dysgonomonas sp. GY617]